MPLSNMRRLPVSIRVTAVFQTFWGVLAAMRQNKLTALIPVVVFLFVISIALYLINLASPIAPFVYSLF